MHAPAAEELVIGPLTGDQLPTATSSAAAAAVAGAVVATAAVVAVAAAVAFAEERGLLLQCKCCATSQAAPAHPKPSANVNSIGLRCASRTQEHWYSLNVTVSAIRIGKRRGARADCCGAQEIGQQQDGLMNDVFAQVKVRRQRQRRNGQQESEGRT